ncbi:hypothetical protein [Luteolibacter sp. AS25]|uniref:hypothetical protein n=1 Tax=Luteolibacter sp. AS25 TaxID=3135776 RepID=UPI00398A9281
MKIILVAAFGIFIFVPACKNPSSSSTDTLRINIDSSETLDFQRFLEAIALLIGEERNSIVSLDVTGETTLSFRSTKDFRFDPVFIHVLQDRVAMGSGSGRHLVTVDELGGTLELLAQAASSSGSEGFILMASEEQVPLQFGLEVLNAVSGAGIPNVMLITPDLLEAPRSRVTEKPSPPTANNKKQNKPEMAAPRNPSD